MSSIIHGSSSSYSGGSAHGFSGWVGVVVEIAPNQYAIYEMTHAEGMFTLEREVETVHACPGDVLGISVPGPTTLTINLTGTAVMRASDQRPAWRTPAGEVEA